MSDIHRLKCRFGEGGAGYIEVVFHVPNTENKFKGAATSVVTDISAPELVLLQVGTLVEVVKHVRIHRNHTNLVVSSKLRSLWQPTATKRQAEIVNEYKFYGTTLTRAS